MLGEETAAVVGADGVVRDDSWMEVFESNGGTIAIVQASGDDYRQTLDAALHYAENPTDPGTLINVLSRELAIFSAACDGEGEHAMRLLPAKTGHAPAEHGAPPPDTDTGLLVTARSTRYRVTPGRTPNFGGRDQRLAYASAAVALVDDQCEQTPELSGHLEHRHAVPCRDADQIAIVVGADEPVRGVVQPMVESFAHSRLGGRILGEMNHQHER